MLSWLRKTDGGRATISFLALLLTWWLLYHLGSFSALLLPSPQEVLLESLPRLIQDGLLLDTWLTLWRSLLGVTLATAVAVPAGLILGQRPNIYAYLELPIDFFRSVPSSALFFLFIFLFGIGDSAKIAVVFYGCSLIVLVGTVYGVRPTREKRERLNVLSVLGASYWQRTTLAVLPDALPHILAALRLSVSLAIVLVVVTEMFLASEGGLGRRIYDSYLTYRIADMYCAILLLGITGFGANRLLHSIEGRTRVWLPSAA